MDEKIPFFLGYGSLTDWANVVDMRSPVYAMMYTRVGAGQFSYTRTEREYIFFAQPHAGEMHYCRLLVSVTEWANDQPLTPDAATRKGRARQAWEVLQGWLDDCGFKVRKAIPATPRDLIFTDGEADFLGYTADRGYYIEGGENSPGENNEQPSINSHS